MANFLDKLLRNKDVIERKNAEKLFEEQTRIFREQNKTCSNTMFFDKNTGEFSSKEELLDVEILKVFYENTRILHSFIMPIIDFMLGAGFDKKFIMESLRTSYEIAYYEIIKIELIEPFFEEQFNLVSKQESDLLDISIINSILMHIPFISEKELSKLQGAIKKIFSNDIVFVPEVRSSIKSQIILALVKIFVYDKEFDYIGEKEELAKILTNAAYKYNGDLDLISENTYDLFLDYYCMKNDFFSLSSYSELMKIYFLTRKVCNDIYEEDELSFDFNMDQLTFNEIIEYILSERLYKKYEIKKLVLSIFYEKVNSFTGINEFMDIWIGINDTIHFIDKQKRKNDFLYGEYEVKRKTIEEIDMMSGIEFEQFICDFFNESGYKCSKTKRTGDQGADLIAIKGEQVLAIQTKCYSSAVGNHAVMEIIAGMAYYKATHGMVITNNLYTKAAIQLASSSNVILWDRQDLIEKVLEKK